MSGSKVGINVYLPVYMAKPCGDRVRQGEGELAGC